MNLIPELISLAQKLDELGLLKEADLLDGMSSSLIKNSHQDPQDSGGLDGDMFGEFLRGYLDPENEESMSVEDAVLRAVKDMEDLSLEGKSFSISNEERERAANYVPLQVSEFFNTIDE